MSHGWYHPPMLNKHFMVVNPIIIPIFVPNSRGVHGLVHMEEPNQIAVNKFSSLKTNLNQFKNSLETSEPVLNRFWSSSEEPNQIAVNKFSSLITNLNQFKNILETSEPVLNRFWSSSEVA